LDIEQLKLILETLGAAGEGTKELALIYFGYLLIKAIGVAAIFANAVPRNLPGRNGYCPGGFVRRSPC
jgi:hypothetical protein